MNIKEEIEKNGNTNLIADSGLNNQQIFAIGDSHSIFFYNSLKIKEHWLGCSNLPISIYRLVNEGLDIYNIGNIIGNQHEKYNIKKDDYVLFFYGYNDVQKNIWLYAKDSYETYINNLCILYLEKINTLKDKYLINPIISCIYPLPIEHNNLTIKGSNDERILYILKMNNILKLLCNTYNFIYFDIYDHISDNNFIKKEYTKDGIHLDYDIFNLQNFIENYILKLITD
jgi:hypothetical protein